MAPKKASAGDRAEQFLSAIGTAGGPIGSPALFSFGAQNLAQQVQAGNVDEYAAIRAQGPGPGVGQPNAPQPPMPRDLDASYLKLNLPGSPLPRNGLLAPRFINASGAIQDQITANEQLMMTQFMPRTGQLPVVVQPPIPQKKGRR